MINSGRLIRLTIITGALFIGATLAIVTLPNSRPVTLESIRPQQLETATAQRLAIAPTLSTSKTSEIAPNSTVIDTSCLGLCLDAQKLLALNTPIDDETYERLSGLAEGLAAHLEKNHSARIDMLDLARTTQDGNKRALLIDAFSLLPMVQREEIGTALMKSDNWLIRTDGIKLSTSPEGMASDKANSLINSFTNEPHFHVKTTILGVLENSEGLKGHQETLDNLSIIMQRETNPQVKSDAFLAKFALQGDPLDAMPDILIALGSGETELQQSALIVLGRVYESDHFVGGLDRIDHGAIKREIEDLKDITFDADDQELIRLLNEADRFYERHFPEN